MKIGLGIVTYMRPLERFDGAWRSAWDKLQDVVDVWVAVDDGSDGEAARTYDRIRDELPFPLLSIPHGGCAASKNAALRHLMDQGCDYLFVMEDDMRVLDPKAVTEYIRVSQQSGVEHFSYAKHGTANENLGMIERRPDGVELWPASVGSWTMWTRNCIETVGYMDEEMYCAMEHVHHTYRCALAGLTTPMWEFADVAGSENWLAPQPDCYATSTFAGKNTDVWTNVADAKVRWNEWHRREYGTDFWI
jgi:GT2 family glycosyltransferase